MVKSVDMNRLTCLFGDEQVISGDHFHGHSVGISVRDGLFGVRTGGVEKRQ